MLNGYARFENGWFVVKVEGFPRMRFLWYSKREALRKYREAYNLKYKKIIWLD